MLIGTLAGLAWVAVVVMTIMLAVKMIQNNMTAAGIFAIIFSCCIVGPVIGLVVGWQNVNTWNNRQFMQIYTALFVLHILLGGGYTASNGVPQIGH